MRRDEWDEADARGEPVRAWRAIAAVDAAVAELARVALVARAALLDRDLAEIERLEAPKDARPQYGKRIGDHTSDALETRRNVAAAETLRLQREEVRRALAKLDEGSYGRCDGCGELIASERLEALPWAAECLGCRSRR